MRPGFPEGGYERLIPVLAGGWETRRPNLEEFPNRQSLGQKRIEFLLAYRKRFDKQMWGDGGQARLLCICVGGEQMVIKGRIGRNDSLFSKKM